ncbi:MAG: signal recognition particle-docking protein FtsY [Alphaproteobacteria bacterium]|nr:signal recognition particle-docking protein FtsY [Alphaproteobacteria bacterium]
MTNWLKKLGFGLKKSSSQLTSSLSSIFKERKLDEATLDELEELLICSDIGTAASSKIIKEFASHKVDKEASDEDIRKLLAQTLNNILQPCQKTFEIGNHNPTVIMMVGVNGAGKTTTIGKLAAKFKNKQISCIAGDTFRAAAVEQLSIWAERNNIRVHKGENGCDTAALCFDGLQEAIKQKDDIVFIDTAGRLQNKTNLIEELQKIVRVIKKVIPQAPHHTLLCLDATTGQNALDQVKTFRQMIDVNGLIINKLDGTAKGGILAAIATECPIPVYFIGVGESIDDMDTFSAQDFANGLLDIN